MVIDFKKFREETGITPEDIALKLGISQTYTSLLLNGHRKMSKERWELLTAAYSNITDYVIDYSNKSAKDNSSNITSESDNDCNIPTKNEELVPAFVLRMHDEERKRFDAQMDKMLEQNSEMLQQNRILVEALRDQARIFGSKPYEVAERATPTPYSNNKKQ